MRLTVAALLRHPSVLAGSPSVVAGEEGLSARVRWIHSSEVLEIAPLLQGGELLLTGGHVLAGVDRAAQERYVRELSERRVAGVAIETGAILPRVPEPMVQAANRLGFPIIELRAVVPFVRVAEAVNAELVNESITRLRFGGELAHSLSVVLAGGGGVQPLLDELARRTSTSVALLDSTGATLARAPDGSDAPRDDLAGPSEPLEAVTTRIAVRGAHMATLAFHPGHAADLELLAVAGDRAAEALSLALLRTASPSPRDIAGSELARSAHRADLAGRLRRLGAAAGFRADQPVLALVVAGHRSGRPGLSGLDSVLRRRGVVAMDTGDADVRVVLGLPDSRRAEEARRELQQDLATWSASQRELVVSLGPAVARLGELSVTMRAAAAAVTGASTYGAAIVVDAAATMHTDWLQGEEPHLGAHEFVQAQLSLVMDLPPSESSAVLETLEAYLDSGCHKTRTAEALHLRRQSLYARLDKAFAMVGGDPTGTPRALPLHLALKLRHVLPATADRSRRG